MSDKLSISAQKPGFYRPEFYQSGENVVAELDFSQLEGPKNQAILGKLFPGSNNKIQALRTTSQFISRTGSPEVSKNMAFRKVLPQPQDMGIIAGSALPEYGDVLIPNDGMTPFAKTEDLLIRPGVVQNPVTGDLETVNELSFDASPHHYDRKPVDFDSTPVSDLAGFDDIQFSMEFKLEGIEIDDLDLGNPAVRRAAQAELDAEFGGLLRGQLDVETVYQIFKNAKPDDVFKIDFSKKNGEVALKTSLNGKPVIDCKLDIPWRMSSAFSAKDRGYRYDYLDLDRDAWDIEIPNYFELPAVDRLLSPYEDFWSCPRQGETLLYWLDRVGGKLGQTSGDGKLTAIEIDQAFRRDSIAREILKRLFGPDLTLEGLLWKMQALTLPYEISELDNQPDQIQNIYARLRDLSGSDLPLDLQGATEAAFMQLCAWHLQNNPSLEDPCFPNAFGPGNLSNEAKAWLQALFALKGFEEDLHLGRPPTELFVRDTFRKGMLAINPNLSDEKITQYFETFQEEDYYNQPPSFWKALHSLDQAVRQSQIISGPNGRQPVFQLDPRDELEQALTELYRGSLSDYIPGSQFYEASERDWSRHWQQLFRGFYRSTGYINLSSEDQAEVVDIEASLGRTWDEPNITILGSDGLKFKSANPEKFFHFSDPKILPAGVVAFESITGLPSYQSGR